MLRLTLKNLRANRVRFAMTTFGVVLAVSFVVAAYVLGDGLRSSFGEVTDEIVAGTDVEVRPADEFGSATRLDDADVATVAAVDGVLDAVGFVEAPENSVRPIDVDGDEISTFGPPQLAFGWVDSATNPFTIVAGSPPSGDAEFVIDVDSADRHGFTIGETYAVITATGRYELSLSGTTSFGSDNSTLGAVLMHIDASAAPTLFGLDGYDAISVALAPSASPEDAQARIASALPGAEVLDRTALGREQDAEFSSGVALLQNVLLAFAGIALFVSVFIIYNTFAIVLGQRSRELALLRALGADPRQLRRSVVGEAVAVGLTAAVAGLAGGVGLSLLLRAAFSAIGAELPDSPVIVSARTVVVALAVSLVVTLVAALGPARRAARVPVMAALRDGVGAEARIGRARLLLGAVALVVGVAAGAAGLGGVADTAGTLALLGVGAGAVFVGVAMVSPLVARPVTALLGWPTRRLLGVSGRLAQTNSGRNPTRTATTAAALMIGLALVSMAFVVGQSLKTDLRATLDRAVTADYVVIDPSDSGLPLPAGVLGSIESAPTIAASAEVRYDDVQVTGPGFGGEVVEVGAVNSSSFGSMVDIDVTSGRYPAPASDEVLVRDDVLDGGIGIGDSLSVTFASGRSARVTVVGVYADASILGEDLVFDVQVFDRYGAETNPSWVVFDATDGLPSDDVAAFVSSIVERYPTIEIETADQYADRIEGMVDELLVVVNVLVALAVIVALIGIANTLGLAVFERTHELGLLRAVGMTRRQVRRMVRVEAAIVAAFGATLGVATGVLFGWALVAAMPDEVLSALDVPWGQILTLVGVAALAGLAAAWLPARRASRLDVLRAIAAT